MLITHNLHSEAHFHHSLSTRVQVSVHHIVRQVIKYAVFTNFMQLQYILPLISTNKSLAVYWKPTLNIQHTAACPFPLPTTEFCVKM
jgi:hypothetical protein